MLIALGFVLIGAFVAATDSMNARRFNPAFYGGWFVAAALPCAVAVALPKNERKTSILIMASMAAIPLGLILAGFGSVVLSWFTDTTGIPTSW